MNRLIVAALKCNPVGHTQLNVLFPSFSSVFSEHGVDTKKTSVRKGTLLQRCRCCLLRVTRRMCHYRAMPAAGSTLSNRQQFIYINNCTSSIVPRHSRRPPGLGALLPCSPGNLAHFGPKSQTNCNSISCTIHHFYEVSRITY